LSFCIVVPTLNAGPRWKEWLNALEMQEATPLATLVIDSGSTDGTIELAEGAGCRVQRISADEFSHSRTRQMGIDMCPASEIVVFLTQDAILAEPYALTNLLRQFEDERVAAAFGRQLPHEGASHVATHARLFNYPDESRINVIQDVDELGLKAVFISNSFAAYRREILHELGGLHFDTIICEDVVLAAKLLVRDRAVAYAADAKVFHSHEYSYWQEFRRYFDIGVFHARENWILQRFGKPTGEGMK